MANEVVERVARALLAVDYPNEVGGEMGELFWDRHAAHYREASARVHRRHARAYGGNARCSRFYIKPPRFTLAVPRRTQGTIGRA